MQISARKFRIKNLEKLNFYVVYIKIRKLNNFNNFIKMKSYLWKQMTSFWNLANLTLQMNEIFEILTLYTFVCKYKYNCPHFIHSSRYLYPMTHFHYLIEMQSQIWQNYCTLFKDLHIQRNCSLHCCFFNLSVSNIEDSYFTNMGYAVLVIIPFPIRLFLQKSRKINFDWSIGPNSNTYSKLNRGSFNFKSVQILIFTDEISRFYAFRLKLYTNNSYLDELIFTPKFYIHLSKRVAIETHFMVPILHAKVESYRAVRHGNVRFLT